MIVAITPTDIATPALAAKCREASVVVDGLGACVQTP